MAEKHLSTTALARLLGKESKELFVLLTNGGWIVKVDGHWQLTAKGKFEGGIYVNHPSYGEYIAWPESIVGHPLLKLLPEAPLTATNLGQKWNLPARLVNLLLAEKQLIKKYLRGWKLTSKGRALGCQQHEAEQSAIPYATWPETLLEEPELLAALRQLHADEQLEAQPALDGHLVNSAIQRRVDNWLYLASVIHARDYELFWKNESVVADFYLPEVQLCIECWAAAPTTNPAATIHQDLEKLQLLHTHQVAYVEVRDENIHQLDELLARELFRHGHAVY